MTSPERKTIPIKPEPSDNEHTVSLFQRSEKIYPRSVTGKYANWRWFFVWATQLVFYLGPWLRWGERQAVLFDLEARRFYIFGLVLYPQDFVFLAALLVISAMSLFLFTAVAGRLWCGYTCPQTVYTEIFMWVERKVEGDRLKRMKLDQSHSFERYWKKGLKHALWIAIALWTGFTFVGYFVPIRELAATASTGQVRGWALFWTLFYGFATYGNAGFMREQVCKYMCPYARFQGAMYDKHTLTVAYDEKRGEPRGARAKSVDPKSKGLGDCVDCTLCVQVCPTGIDIRNGQQYECIGCGACIDVCNTVMDKLGYEPGLIRYATEHSVEHRLGTKEIIQRIIRPRTIIYGILWLCLVTAFITSLSLRSGFKVNIVRDRAALARIVEGGQLENVYRVQVMNTKEEDQSYQMEANGLPGLQLHGETRLTLKPAEARWVVVQMRLPYGAAKSGSHPVYIDTVSSSGERLHEKTIFFVPR